MNSWVVKMQNLNILKRSLKQSFMTAWEYRTDFSAMHFIISSVVDSGFGFNKYIPAIIAITITINTTYVLRSLFILL